jgi:hypothetical protein
MSKFSSASVLTASRSSQTNWLQVRFRLAVVTTICWLILYGRLFKISPTLIYVAKQIVFSTAGSKIVS